MMEKTGLLISLAWRNLWRNPRRTGLVLVAVAVGIWSMVAFTALLQAWNRSSLDATLKDLTGQGQIHVQGYLDNPGPDFRMKPPAADLATILDGPEVAHWAPRINVPAALQSAYETMPVSLVGIDPAREYGLSFIPDAVHDGAYLTDNQANGILLGRKLAKRLKTRVGQRVVLMSQSANGSLAERGFKVVGIYSAAPQVEDQDVFIAIGQAQSMLAMDKDMTGITFDLKDISGLDAFIAKLHAAAPKLDIQSWATLRPMAHSMNQLMQGFIEIWIIIMFVLMAFGIVNTLQMSLHERVRELALFQALGLRPRLIFTQVMFETAIEILLGIVIGSALAALTILAFHNGLNLGFLAQGAQWLGAGRVLYPQLDWHETVNIGLIVFGLGLLTCFYPVWRIIRKVPVQAISRSPS